MTMSTSSVVENGAAMSNVIRIKGKVKATFPNRGFFWIDGDDGIKYFAHQVQVTNNWLVLDMHEGQGCEFVAKNGDARGPNAESIVMDSGR